MARSNSKTGAGICLKHYKYEALKWLTTIHLSNKIFCHFFLLKGMLPYKQD